MDLSDPSRFADEAFKTYMTDKAPSCPSCGEDSLVANGPPEVNKMGRLDSDESLLIEAYEFYTCSACGIRGGIKIELDRVSDRERHHERELAVKRAELRRELYRQHGYGSLFFPKATRRKIEAEVQAQFPRRGDPDLMKRWIEEHDKVDR